MTSERKDEFLGVRVTPSERHKVIQLASETGRSVSGVVRALIRQAEVSGTPDLVIRGQEAQT